MKNKGFTTVELLITLFIAAAFLMSGYQLYSMIIKDGGETRAQANASNKAYEYIQKTKANSTYILSTCTPNSSIDLSADGTDGDADGYWDITITSLSNVKANIAITCPYGVATPQLSKITVTIRYGNSTPQDQVVTATYAKP